MFWNITGTSLILVDYKGVGAAEFYVHSLTLLKSIRLIWVKLEGTEFLLYVPWVFLEVFNFDVKCI